MITFLIVSMKFINLSIKKMIKISTEKIYNSYIIETNNLESAILSIKNFARDLGFDRNLLDSDNHPDFRIINREGDNYKVDMIREKILDDILIAPYVSNFKIYVLCNCHKLNSDSKNTNQNILLKTLEDTPKNLIFFLIIDNLNKLLDTIKSRCIKIYDREVLYELDDLDDLILNDAIKLICDYRYKNYIDILEFFEQYDKKNVDRLVYIYIQFLRDGIVYKETYANDLIKFKKYNDYIIEFSSNNRKEIIEYMLDGFIDLANNKNMNIDKSLIIADLLYNTNFKFKNKGD